jgi:hypothetical protein
MKCVYVRGFPHTGRVTRLRCPLDDNAVISATNNARVYHLDLVTLREEIDDCFLERFLIELISFETLPRQGKLSGYLTLTRT